MARIMVDLNKSYWRELFNKLFGDSNSQKLPKSYSELSDKEKEILSLRQQENYKKYLNELALANSDEMFSNGGIEYASILMSVLLNHTNDIARIYCQ